MHDLKEYQSYLEPLTREEVVLTGAWTPGRIRDWRGLAISSKPLASIVFLQHGSTIQWAKSERPQVEGEIVRLLMGLFDKTGLDVGVCFSAGDGQRDWRTSVESPEYRPFIPVSLQTHTAELLNFCDVAGDPSVKLGLLFLTDIDVQTGRNGIWHVRPNTAAKLEEPFKTILTYGRAGALALDEGTQ